MKRLCVVSTFEEADRIARLLEGKGIPIDWRGGSATRNVRAPYSAALYVCLDSQFEDALAILRDPSHVPAQPVDAAQYRLDIEVDGMKSVLNYLLAPCLVVVAIFVLLIVAIYFTHSSEHHAPPDSTMRAASSMG